MCLKSAKRTSVGIDSARVYSNTYPTHSKKYQKLLLFFCLSSLTFIGLSTTYMASGMELNNPDSTDSDTLFPCGKCHSPVTYDHKSLQCETCDKWYHAPCQRLVIFNMITYQIQAVLGTAQSAIVQTTHSFLPKI